MLMSLSETWCKDNANERNESLLSNCRVQLICCKDTKNISNPKNNTDFLDCNPKINADFWD